LLIQHANYYCQKYTPTDCFFGDFGHWARPYSKVTFPYYSEEEDP